MRFLVFGAAGAQGGAVARTLAESGYEVRGFVRTGKAPRGVEPFRGDLGDAARVKEAFAGVTHASVVLPMVYEPETVAAFTRHVISGARAAGVRRLVFNTGNRLPDHETGVAAFDTRRAAVRALRASGLPVVVLRPALYLENLLAPGVMADGVLRYPLPAALPVAWLTHTDLAALTAAALTGFADKLDKNRPAAPTGDGPAGELDTGGPSAPAGPEPAASDTGAPSGGRPGCEVDAGGPSALTGPELAAVFGLRYEEQDVDAFEAGLAGVVGAVTAGEVAATYRWIASAAPPSLLGTGPSLGVRLTTVATWAGHR